jgi:hypothetical protein
MNSEAMVTGDETADALVALSTEHGTITAAFVTDATVRDGVVSITHGHAHENPGDLTSGDVAVDPLTAMPRVAGLEVDVSASRD